METIAKLLEEIMTAIYGKDVRQSIHDAIAQCYADARHSAYLVAVDNGFQGTEEEWLDSLHVKINGQDTFDVVSGEAITMKQEGDKLTISSIYHSESWEYKDENGTISKKGLICL